MGTYKRFYTEITRDGVEFRKSEKYEQPLLSRINYKIFHYIVKFVYLQPFYWMIGQLDKVIARLHGLKCNNDCGKGFYRDSVSDEWIKTRLCKRLSLFGKIDSRLYYLDQKKNIVLRTRRIEEDNA